MGFTFYIGELRVFFPYDSIYPEQRLGSMVPRKRILQLQQLRSHFWVQGAHARHIIHILTKISRLVHEVPLHVRAEASAGCQRKWCSGDAHWYRRDLSPRINVWKPKPQAPRCQKAHDWVSRHVKPLQAVRSSCAEQDFKEQRPWPCWGMGFPCIQSESSTRAWVPAELLPCAQCAHACLSGKTVTLFSLITSLLVVKKGSASRCTFGPQKPITKSPPRPRYQWAHPEIGRLVYCTRTVPEMSKALEELRKACKSRADCILVVVMRMKNR